MVDITYDISVKPPGAVLDSNVLVAGPRSRRGASRRLLEHFANGKLRVHVSVPLVLEYESVLRRQAPSLGLSQTDVSGFVDFVCRAAEQHVIHFLWRPALKDPKDDMVLEVAIAAGADVVSFNVRDFEGAERFGVRVWEPGAYLRRLEARS